MIAVAASLSKVARYRGMGATTARLPACASLLASGAYASAINSPLDVPK
ncbi:MAG: hypothetical protein OXI80_15345 [Caldilineaceae bacterium]|nr:hypothetical protein [Caldilineaceae bacterium]MDE0339045.1 hypothetical protein [Caldilineaceae bacterium]